MRPTPWWRKRTALLLVRTIEALERAARRLYGVARRLAPAEFEAAEQLREQLEEITSELLLRPPHDFDPDERRRW